MPDYRKEWMERAALDYYAPFILLWLSFNSWYRSHYSDLENGQDREFINTLKTDDTGRNRPFRKFQTLIRRDDKPAMVFRNDIEMFHRALDAASLSNQPKGAKYISLEKALIDFSQKNNETGYITLLRKSRQQDKVKLHELHVTNDYNQLFAGVLECIYQCRCLLVHGNLEPAPQNHEVAEYCYKVLLAIMPD
jgi:hypothetical protein